MHSFLVLCMVLVCAADISGLKQNGYNYAKPQVSNTESGFDIIFPAELRSASSVDPSIGGLDMRPSGYTFDESALRPSQATVSKRYFTITAQENTDEDDDETGSMRLEERKNYDIIFARAPTTSIKSALKAVAKYTGEQQTAVYILSKTLGAQDIGNALRISGTKPSKPEVHFIKYNTPEERQHVQHIIRSQYDNLGGHTEHGGEESAPVQSVIGSLGQRRTSFQRFRGNNYHGSTTSLLNRYLPPRF